jgi:hypothetical protein
MDHLADLTKPRVALYADVPPEEMRKFQIFATNPYRHRMGSNGLT